jgi:hypothetical protein
LHFEGEEKLRIEEALAQLESPLGFLNQVSYQVAITEEDEEDIQDGKPHQRSQIEQMLRETEGKTREKELAVIASVENISSGIA